MSACKSLNLLGNKRQVLWLRTAARCTGPRIMPGAGIPCKSGFCFEPLSRWERGWGEGTANELAAQTAAIWPHPQKPLVAVPGDLELDYFAAPSSGAARHRLPVGEGNCRHFFLGAIIITI